MFIFRKLPIDEIFKMTGDEQFTEDLENKSYGYLDLSMGMTKDAIFYSAFDKNFLAGIIQYNKDPYDKNTYAMVFVGVHPKYRKKGIATKLIEYMVKDLIGKTEILRFSRYESEGESLIPIVQKIAKENPQITILHRKRADVFQNACYDYLTVGDQILVDDPNKGLKGKAVVFGLNDSVYPKTEVIFQMLDSKSSEPLKTDSKFVSKI